MQWGSKGKGSLNGLQDPWFGFVYEEDPWQQVDSFCSLKTIEPQSQGEETWERSDHSKETYKTCKHCWGIQMRDRFAGIIDNDGNDETNVENQPKTHESQVETQEEANAEFPKIEESVDGWSKVKQRRSMRRRRKSQTDHKNLQKQSKMETHGSQDCTESAEKNRPYKTRRMRRSQNKGKSRKNRAIAKRKTSHCG